MGETPVSINKEVLDYSAIAVEAIEKAVPNVIANKEEFERIRTRLGQAAAKAGEGPQPTPMPPAAGERGGDSPPAV